MSERLTDEQIVELERLEREACPAPWHVHERGRTLLTSQSHPLAELSDPGHREVLDRLGRVRAGRDGELIVAARNALPALLAEVRALRSAREEALEEAARSVEAQIGSFQTAGGPVKMVDSALRIAAKEIRALATSRQGEPERCRARCTTYSDDGDALASWICNAPLISGPRCPIHGDETTEAKQHAAAATQREDGYNNSSRGCRTQI